MSRMLEWHHCGLPVNDLLPNLSIYMGHTKPACTYWYLTALPELLSAAGDCFQNPNGDQTLLGVTYVTAAPCTRPHNAQIFAEFSPTGTSFPGNTALDKQASLGCQARIAGNVDKSKITDAMSLNYLVPQQQSWADGHRTIACFIVDTTSSLTSSLLVPPATS